MDVEGVKVKMHLHHDLDMYKNHGEQYATLKFKVNTTICNICNIELQSQFHRLIGF